MRTLSVEDYKSAVKSLSPGRIEILQSLYYCPNSSAKAKELAVVMGYKGHSAANRHIGGIGEAIAKHLGLKPKDLPSYNDPPRPGYFAVVGGDDYERKGWMMPTNLKKALVGLGLVSEKSTAEKAFTRLVTEVQPFDEKSALREGKAISVLVNRYERNIQARNQCLKHHGHRCVGCGFEFGDVYGESARGFIHVHHLVCLSDIGKDYKIDPVNDLLPLCPNCHSVAHRSKPALTIQQLRKLIRKHGKPTPPGS